MPGTSATTVRASIGKREFTSPRCRLSLRSNGDPPAGSYGPLSMPASARASLRWLSSIVSHPRNMSLRFVKLFALFTALHAVCVMTSSLYCISRGMTRFDNPVLTETYIESFTCRVADVLLQPTMFVWRAAGIKDASSLLQWVAVLLNSAAWGATLSIALVCLIRGSSRLCARGVRRTDD